MMTIDKVCFAKLSSQNKYAKPTGTECQIICTAKGDWDAVDATVSDDPGLLKAIGRNIKLRYRL